MTVIGIAPLNYRLMTFAVQNKHLSSDVITAVNDRLIKDARAS
jgi:hypothetical protein